MTSIHPFRFLTLTAVGLVCMLAVWACRSSEPPDDPRAQAQQKQERSAAQRPGPHNGDAGSTTIR